MAEVFTTDTLLLLKAEFKTRNELVPSRVEVKSAAWILRNSVGHDWEK